MNRYPSWVYATVIVAVVLGLLYTIPNFFGEAPAVQVSSARPTLKVDSATLSRVEEALKNARIPIAGTVVDSSGIRVRFDSVETQAKARDALTAALNPKKDAEDYIIALNLMSQSPSWLRSLGALPMYLGLDLRGGVHFLFEVSEDGALKKRLDGMAGDVRTRMRERKIRFLEVTRQDEKVIARFRDAETRAEARKAVAADFEAEYTFTETAADNEARLEIALRPEARRAALDTALKQNMSTLGNRINELGVAEPVIQQQGANRIVVQLPGVQDTALAKEILGRTATLEIRLVDEEAMRNIVELGPDVFPERTRDGIQRNVPTKRQVVLTGDRFTGAQSGFDDKGRPMVSVNLDEQGGRVMRQVTRENLQRLMAIVLFEKGRGEAISVATIQGEFGNRFQITGMFSADETNKLSLLIRAGSLAAPMEIIEERTVGPSLGKDNIEKGFKSTLWGFLAIITFMCVYYTLFGLFSSLALGANLLFLIAILSLLQATLTLPGIAAIALTLGMAIDANVLINERIREELRGGQTPQAAISVGYDKAFATILDSNITTLIAGLALLIFGSGPIRGFAVVHCLGILTSIFSSVVVSRALVNATYGRQRKLEHVAIGDTSWK